MENMARQLSFDGSPQSATDLTNLEFKSLLSQCIHCGLCLPACPTYAVYHTEMESPRGRIMLMRAAAEERIPLHGPFQQHIDLCLGCQACETACPSGVQYGSLLESSRAAIAAERERTTGPGGLTRLGKWIGLNLLLRRPSRLRPVARMLKLYQLSGISSLIRQLDILPPRLAAMEALLPPLTLEFPNYSKPAKARHPRRGTVAFLSGCVQDAMLGGVNLATIRVLQRNGYDVIFPHVQSCCGAAPLHIGETEWARQMARRTIDALGDHLHQIDAIISNAGGCGATLKEYNQLLRHETDYYEKACLFAQKVQDISEFLDERLHVKPGLSINKRVVYVDSCHLRHAQKASQQPRKLLNSIPAIELVELDRPDFCCGSAGVYNIWQAETAHHVLEFKMADIIDKKPDIIVTSNPGCHLQMIYGARKYGLNVEILHLIELVDRGYG